MIKNGKYFSLPDESDDDFKSLFMRVAATGIGRPVDHDGCPQGPWTPELLAEAISQIDANRTGIDLRTVQLWFKDNEKGISTSNIRWLARVLGCNDPEGSSAWQVALMRSQARLAARRHSRHRTDGGTGKEHVDPPGDIKPEQVQCDVRRPWFDLARVSEAIFSRGSPLNLPASVFAGAVALQFVSYFLSIHSVTYVRDDGITKQIGFLWAPNWTVVFLILMPIFFAFVIDQVTTWKNESRVALLSYIGEHDRSDQWMRRVEASSYTYWAAFLLCLGFAGVFQWVSVRLLPVLHGDGPFAIDWGSLAYVRPDEFGIFGQAAFTGAAYLYMSLCFYLFIAGLILLSNLVDDFAHICKALGPQPSIVPIDRAQSAGTRIMRGILRASVAGLLVAMCMKLQSLYVVTTAPSVWGWLISDSGSIMTSFGNPIDWGDYSMPTHFTSLLVALMVGTVYLYAAIRIGGTTPVQVSLARPTTAVLFLALVYLLIGVVAGFSILLAIAIAVAVYGFFDPYFGSRYERQMVRLNVS
ncbi:MAG: hypothetical protein COB97_00105 [Paracoccus sp.]|nr:MAG: hypothetical protein COB97_00105 [Paracoccus sp. (in: a-proteobacteria)]